MLRSDKTARRKSVYYLINKLDETEIEDFNQIYTTDLVFSLLFAIKIFIFPRHACLNFPHATLPARFATFHSP